MSFDDIPDYIKKNYEQLIADRGWDNETAAAAYEHQDPRLAAYLRSRGTSDPKSEPRERKGSARSKVAAPKAGEQTVGQTAEPKAGEQTVGQTAEPKAGEQTADAGQA